MADFYTASIIGAKIVSGKNIIAIYNGTGSGKIIKIYRIWLYNNQTQAITGVLTKFQLRRISAIGGGIPCQVVKYNSISDLLPSQIIITTGPSASLGDIVRQITWSTDEPAIASGGIDEAETNSLYTLVWNCGLFNQTLQPLTFRYGEGLAINHVGTTNVGVIDSIIEFSTEDV